MAASHAARRRRPQRLTRKEQQARTRAGLMKSAARVFSRRGLERASVDEIAEDAGFTKGAFYANFASKEEIFLAMLDERFAERLHEIERITGDDAEPQEQARRGGASFEAYLRADPEWQRLFFEFSAYAARNEHFRKELVKRYRLLQERIAELYRRRMERLGIESPIPVEQVAAFTFAMANGVAFDMLLDPGALPDDAFATMLGAFFAGLQSWTEG